MSESNCALATFKVKIHKTTDKKNLKEGKKTYTYGAINIKSEELAEYIGKTVKVRVEED